MLGYLDANRLECVYDERNGKSYATVRDIEIQSIVIIGVEDTPQKALAVAVDYLKSINYVGPARTPEDFDITDADAGDDADADAAAEPVVIDDQN